MIAIADWTPRRDAAARVGRSVEAQETRELLTACAPRSPFRALDWRWRLAACLAEGRGPPRRRWVDRWVRHAAQFLIKRDGPRPRRGRRQSALAAAHQVRSAADPRPRWEIEARLLAGQDDAAIAARLGLDPGTIAAYERTFYAVRDRLDCIDTVATLAFGPAVYDGSLRADDLGTVLKVLAYNFGPLVVDALHHSWGWPGTSFDAGARRVDPRLDRALALASAVLTLPLDEAAATLAVRYDALADALERRAEARSVGPVSTPVVATDFLTTSLFDPRAAAYDGPSAVVGPDAAPIVLPWPGPGPGPVPTTPITQHRLKAAAG